MDITAEYNANALREEKLKQSEIYTVLVCGSHRHGSRDHVFGVLDSLHEKKPIQRLITGGADYIDTFALEWALARRVSHCVHYADWKKYNSFAGPQRNRMLFRLYHPSLVVAFEGGAGTLDAIRRANIKQVEVIRA